MEGNGKRIRLDKFFSYGESEDGKARIEVKMQNRAEMCVSERLFGLFTEHLGRNVYGGAWAQILPNGGFESFDQIDEAVPEHQRPRLKESISHRLEMTANQFGMPRLTQYAELGVAPYWSPVGEGAHFSLQSGINGLAQKITMIDSDSAGIETPIFLPLHRVCTYHFRACVLVTPNADGVFPKQLSIQILKVKEQISEQVPENETGKLLAEECVTMRPTALSGEWHVIRAVITIADSELPRGVPLKFRVMIHGSGSIAFDQMLLFPIDAIDGWDPDVVRMLRHMKVSVIRFPGGNFASGYHWQDGVGPIESRPEKPNPAWPEWEPNHVGTDEWMNLCELVGAEPLICVNAGNGSPQEAADWVRYCNDPITTKWGALRASNGHPAPYNVRLWEVGNELWGDFQIGHVSSNEYGSRFRSFAKAMKDADPSIQLIAIGGSMPDVIFADETRRNEGWLGAIYAHDVLKEHADHIWGIAEHAVMGGVLHGADSREAYLELIAHTHHVGDLLKRNQELLEQQGGKVALAQTEQTVAVGGKERPSNQSLAAAIVWSGFMNWFLRSDNFVPLFTRTAMINHGDLMEKVREITYPLPGYWAQAMYANQPGRIPVGIDAVSPVMDVGGKYFKAATDIPVIDGVALLSTDSSTLVVILTNRHPDQAIVTDILIDGCALEEAADLELLTGAGFWARNYWHAPDLVRPQYEQTVGDGNEFVVELPPHSIAVVTFRVNDED